MGPNTGPHCAWLGQQPQHVDNGYMTPPGPPFEILGPPVGCFLFSVLETSSSFPEKEHHVELAMIHELFRSNALIV